MKQSLDDHTLYSTRFKGIIYLLVAVLYFSHIGTNAIWTPNESFYAEAVREMFESGNFLEFYYNYEPRFNKPPLTYWLIALSVWIFDFSEFAIRLPIVLLAFATNFVAARIAAQLYGHKVAFWTFICMSLSFQFVANKAYASPEIPLTFFFTLSMYLFLKAWQTRSRLDLTWAYIALGFTVLVKGYPYYVVIAAVWVLFFLLQHRFNLKAFWAEARFFLFLPAVMLSILIGMAWIIYMMLNYGNAFTEVLNAETLDRALSKRPYTWEDPFFYPAVISWSFLPYSLAAYTALVMVLRKADLRQLSSLPLAWLGAMLLIFTISTGKIPTYFIQAHPALAMLVAMLIVRSEHIPLGAWTKVWNISFWLPAILFFLASVVAVPVLGLRWTWILTPLIGLLFLLWPWERIGAANTQRLLPFISIYIPLFMLSFAVLPALEDYRPYRALGEVLEGKGIDHSVPVWMEGRILHNLPYYAQRRMIRDATLADLTAVKNGGGGGLALVKEDTWKALDEPEVLWEGLIYEKTSESRFAIFIRAWLRAEAGNPDAFEYYRLVLLEGS